MYIFSSGICDQTIQTGTVKLERCVFSICGSESKNSLYVALQSCRGDAAWGSSHPFPSSTKVFFEGSRGIRYLFQGCSGSVSVTLKMIALLSQNFIKVFMFLSSFALSRCVAMGNNKCSHQYWWSQKGNNTEVFSEGMHCGCVRESKAFMNLSGSTVANYARAVERGGSNRAQCRRVIL